MNQADNINDDTIFRSPQEEIESLIQERVEITPNKMQDLKEEALRVRDLLNQFEDEYLDERKEFFYILSLRWFNLWKAHVSYEYVTKNQEPDGKYFGQLTLPKINNDIVVEDSRLIKYPQDDHYCNVELKPIQQERDYIIVTENTWNYLSSKYPAIEVKRPCYTLPDGKRRVEVMLKKIQFTPVNNVLLRSIDHNKVSELKTFTIQVFSQTTLKQFKEDVSAITATSVGKQLFDATSNFNTSSTHYNADSIRFWKLETQLELKNLFSYFKEETNKSRSYEYRIPFKGTYLSGDEDKKIEEAEIADNDIVCLEARDEGKGWNLTGDGAPAVDKCEFCNKYDVLPVQCACKKVAYCSEECKFRDKKFHQMRCDKASEEEEKEEAQLVESSNSRLGVCGLQNLGNTCFMNGGLQCMLNMKELTEYFLANKYEKEINEVNPLGTKGKLVKKYAGLVRNVWYGTSPVYSPWALKHALSQFAPMFSGYQQHDSQEFLAYLVDGIHEDLNRVKNKPFTESIESDNQPDYEVAMKSWENHLKRNQSVIVDLLHGQYKSTIICPQCNRISITFDPFNCVSLPIPSKKEKEIDFFFLFANNKSKPVKMNIKFPSATHMVSQLKEETGRLLNKNPNNFHFVFSSHTSKEVVKDEDKTPTNILRKKKKLKNLFAFEIPEEDLNADPEDVLPTDIFTTKKATNYFGNVVHKSHTFIRTVYLRKSYNAREVYLKVWKYYRFIYDECWPENEREEWLKLSDEEAFKKIYDNVEDIDEKPFTIHLVTNTRGFQECWFCGDRKCENCPLACHEKIQLRDILAKIRDPDHSFELEIFFKNVPEHIDLSKLNAYVDFQKENEKPEEAAKSTNITIYDCFELFSVPEQLGEENAWYCNKCKAHQRATKKMEIYKAPPIMMVHLKRFKGGGSFLSKGKITEKIDFPTTGLNVGPYVLNHELPTDYPVERIVPNFETPSTQTTDGATSSSEESKEPQVFKPKAKENAGDNNKGPLYYDLFGVVNHYGNLGFGHYTAYAMNHKTGEWHQFDDSSVSRESPNGVCTPAAYVLFYKRRDWNFDLY